MIENKPGAGTIVGTNAVVNAPADDYTIRVAISAHVINPSLHANLPYDTVRDLAGVSLLSYQSIVVAATPTWRRAMCRRWSLAKRTPGGLNYLARHRHRRISPAGAGRAAGIELTIFPTTAVRSRRATSWPGRCR